MKDYLIYTDSAADIPLHYFKEHQIGIVPMGYVLNGADFLFHSDDEDRDAVCDELYKAEIEGADVHTSQITPHTYIECFTPQLEAGNDILYICFSSGMSETYSNAVMAKNQLEEDFPDRKVRVVDSLGATTGQGILTLTACMNRAKGMNLEENAAWLEAHVRYLCHRFTVGDLDYLHKGGRVSKATALVGGMLNIKPLMIINDEGKLQVVGKARGHKASLAALVKSYQSELGAPDMPDYVFIAHSSMYERAEELRQMILAVSPEGTVCEIICLSPIIGAHTGPDLITLGSFGLHRKEGD